MPAYSVSPTGEAPRVSKLTGQRPSVDDGDISPCGSSATSDAFVDLSAESPTPNLIVEHGTLQMLIAGTVAEAVSKRTKSLGGHFAEALGDLEAKVEAKVAAVRHEAAENARKNATAIQALQNKCAAALQGIKAEHHAALDAAKTECTTARRLSNYKYSSLANIWRTAASAFKRQDKQLAGLTSDLKCFRVDMEKDLVNCTARLNEEIARQTSSTQALQADAQEMEARVQELDDLVQALGVTVAQLTSRKSIDRKLLSQLLQLGPKEDQSPAQGKLATHGARLADIEIRLATLALGVDDAQTPHSLRGCSTATSNQCVVVQGDGMHPDGRVDNQTANASRER